MLCVRNFLPPLKASNVIHLALCEGKRDFQMREREVLRQFGTYSTVCEDEV